MKQVLLSNSYLFRKGTFLGVAIVLKESVFSDRSALPISYQLCLKRLSISQQPAYRYTMVWFELKFLNLVLLKTAKNVLILIQNVLQICLFEKLVVFLVFSNKLWKTVCNSCESKDVAMTICYN